MNDNLVLDLASFPDCGRVTLLPCAPNEYRGGHYGMRVVAILRKRAQVWEMPPGWEDPYSSARHGSEVPQRPAPVLVEKDELFWVAIESTDTVLKELSQERDELRRRVHQLEGEQSQAEHEKAKLEKQFGLTKAALEATQRNQATDVERRLAAEARCRTYEANLAKVREHVGGKVFAEALYPNGKDGE
jgi:hypothetical protein